MELLDLDLRNADVVDTPRPVMNPDLVPALRPVLNPKKTPALKPAISVVGLGYVGAVSMACLSSLGHRCIGVDVDARKVEQIAAGESPIHEQDLGETLSEGVANGLIEATDDLERAVWDTDVTFVSVGTPTAADGGCDYRYIEAAAEGMARGLRRKRSFHVFVMRCSIPPGTTLSVMAPIIERISGRKAGRDFGVCFNPEFLREGVAIADFHNPPKTVIGTTDLRSAEILRDIYAPVDAQPIFTSIEAAEMVKYVDNVWHATKVCFANEVGRLCKPSGVDSREVMDIFVQDHKLNLSAYYLKPGFAYGGSCLPKEVRAVQHMAKEAGVTLPMIGNLERSNREHIDEAVRMVRATGARRVGILGLAFKPGTDDLRESPILEVMAALHAEGVALQVHDEAITKDTPLEGQLAYVRHGSKGGAELAANLPAMLNDDLDEVVEGAEVLVVCHASEAYRSKMRRSHARAVIDLVGLYNSPCETRAPLEGIGW
ncbi:MAG: nucleotide sugar dehydrogenase [Pseudomonadota bacterium]|uniref:nucleotide sugar dehydrogenase n=1 Tax=Thalassovita sp. TaxID=1979401 RepID=UPI002AB060AF|nr:nucleotide sugar dehydrogenase [Thalassovita sp.]MEC7961750.1 nucleotide sugar dehydrogenase [Pseudomonadota bacterium]MEC8295333.1 nucleotide sugar dehydrogenase [Pseudomonadota bacterium]